MAFAPKHFFRRLSLTTIALAVAMTVAPVAVPKGTPLIGVTAAEAGHRHRHRHHHGIGAAAVIGGILGIGIGIGLADPYYSGPSYYGPRHYGPRPLYRVRPVHYHAPRHRSRAWYRYCASKYRSFDARSGTYQPYHGPRRRCH